jgi:hypothetical protein
MKRTRSRERFLLGSHRPSPFWAALESATATTLGLRPFDDAEVTRNGHDHYLQSRERTRRFVVAIGHKRFDQRENSSPDLGPVETDLVNFAQSPHPTLVVLIGGMGSGKSTTLRYVLDKHLDHHAVIFCNLDANVQLNAAGISEVSDHVVAHLLADYISTPLNKYISPDEEITTFWTWLLSEEAAMLPSIHIFSTSQNRLRDELKGNWRSESPAALDIRLQCKQMIQQNPLGNLTYQAARIDYYLTQKCRGDRSALIIIIDNVDPLPPQVQFKMLDLASRVQATARCKVLISLRPLTYSSNFQGANRTVEVIEHVGPAVIDLIAHRVRTRVLDVGLPHFDIRLREEGREHACAEADAKRWAGEILQTLVREPRSSLRGDPSARMFIDGVCGYSLRAGLVLASDIFASPILSSIDVIDTDHSKHRVRDHEIIRAALTGASECFVGKNGRVIDNVFDLGSGVTSCSCTCKIRLLKRLAAATNNICTVGQVRQHLACFGYNDQAIREAINATIAQSKRLAWSDSVAQYVSLDGYQNTTLQISKAGLFYLNYAMFNLEYVQEVHVDVLLPEGETLEHDPRRFSERLRSLELFIRYLVQQDQLEVKRVLLNNEAHEYVSTYDEGMLFSSEIVEALERQVTNIGRALMQGKQGTEKRGDVQETIARWQNLNQVTLSAARRLSEKLVAAAG